MRNIDYIPSRAEKLTEAQEVFCQEYIIDLDIGRAYGRAYPKQPKSKREAAGLRLFSKFKIQRRIRVLKIERADRLQLTADSVLRKIMEVAERCMQAIPVLDEDGGETGEWTFKEQGALRALELLGKHLNIFVERYQISNPIQEILARKLEALSPGDIRSFVHEFKRVKALDDANRIEPIRN